VLLLVVALQAEMEGVWVGMRDDGMGRGSSLAKGVKRIIVWRIGFTGWAVSGWSMSSILSANGICGRSTRLEMLRLGVVGLSMNSIMAVGKIN
jgi:hypothetical protein